MSCRRGPRVSSFSSSPAGRTVPCTVTQGRSCHQLCRGSGSPCRRRERYGLCGRNASIRWYRWAHTWGRARPTRAAIRTRAARIWCITGPWRIVMAISLVPTAEGGNMQRHKRPARPQVRCVLFTHTYLFVQGRVIHMRTGGAVLRSLDGEGVFEFFHPRFQILDLALLIFQEQVFDAVKSGSHLGAQSGHVLLDLFEILLRSRGLEALVDHAGQVFDGGEVCFCHMYTSIPVWRGVSRRARGLAVLLHEPLRGACGNVEDIQDMRIEIPGRHFGFECSQQSTKFHRSSRVRASPLTHSAWSVPRSLGSWPCSSPPNNPDSCHTMQGSPYACGPRWASER